jgi:hypothetical protein
VHLLTGIAVPAVPIISEAVLGIATLAAVLVFIVCLGLREGWDHTIGYGLRWIANQIEDVGVDVGGFLSVHPFGFVADVFRDVDHYVSHALAVAALNSEKACAWLWHQTGRMFWWSVHETKHLAVDTWHLFQHTVTVTVPDAAKWARREATDVAHSLVKRAEAEARAADVELGHLAHVADAKAIAAEHAAEHALDWSEAQVGHIGREIDALKGKVANIARVLSPAAIVALIGATIFNDLGLGWLKCGNVGRLGRAVCGMPTRLLEDLLELFAGAVLFSSICELLPLITVAVDDVGLGLVEAIHASGLSVCSHRYPPPPPMPPIALSLPTSSSATLSLGG